MLDEQGVEYRYREYTREPFTKTELRRILKMLGVKAGTLLRKRDKANAELGLEGDESDAVLIGHMVEHPTLVQRPIALLEGRAVIGRPVEKILELL